MTKNGSLPGHDRATTQPKARKFKNPSFIIFPEASALSVRGALFSVRGGIFSYAGPYAMFSVGNNKKYPREVVKESWRLAVSCVCRSKFPLGKFFEGPGRPKSPLEVVKGIFRANVT